MSDTGRKLPIDRPCSACSAGDYEMKYHSHEPPFCESSPQPEAPRKGAPYTAIVDSNAVEFPAAPAQAGQQENAELCRLARAEADTILVESRNEYGLPDWPGTERIAQGIVKVAKRALELARQAQPKGSE